MPRSWTVGSHPDCDLVVDLPTVSSRHCRLTPSGDGYVLEDLGSSNGTFVDGVRIVGEVPVRRGDRVTLGLTTPLPWPDEGARPGAVTFRIGRAADNDLVVDLPMVSGYHARIVRDDDGVTWIEDLGSSNGTALGSPDRKVTRSPVAPGDTIYLGSHPVPAAQVLVKVDPALVPPLSFRGDELVIGRDSDCGRVVMLPMVSGRHARLVRSGGRVTIEDLGSSNGTFVNGRRVEGPTEVGPGDVIGLGSHAMLLIDEPATLGVEEAAPGGVPPTVEPVGAVAAAPSGVAWPARSWRPAVLLAQAPPIGIGIALAARNPATALSWLALAAVWFGLSDAVLGNPLEAGPIRPRWGAGHAASVLVRLGALAALCVIQCALAWAIASAVGGLVGPGPASVGLLTLAALVGLASGLMIVLLAPRPAVAWAALGPIVLVLWLFGGERQALPRMEPWARAVANVLPTRWAFEGLLLLEADARAGRDPAPADSPDLAEGYFPAETGRTGPRGAAMALGFLLVGLAASAAFTARASRPAP